MQVAKFPRGLPALRVAVSRKPMKLQKWGIPTTDSRLAKLTELVTQLFREERIEIAHHRAVECRQYAERIIQMAIEYGPEHELAKETYKFWINEKDLINKLFNVYVPRYLCCGTSYTDMYVLPHEHIKRYHTEGFTVRQHAILEMKGHPYPPAVPQPENHENSLLNILLREAENSERPQRLAIEFGEESDEIG